MNPIQAYKVLGLSSGSSLDGINASIITTDGVDVFEFGKTFDIPYDDNLHEGLRHLHHHFSDMDNDEKQRIENALTEFHIGAAREIMADYEDVTLVGFGGHVVCHRPAEHILYQIGDGQKLANALGVRVVGKFRNADILAGGQGAPLSAIYHAALAQKEEKPAIFVDVGGLSAITFIGQNGELMAFDAGPGNAAINEWVNKHGGMHMDYNGKLGITGKINEDVLASMMRHKFLDKQPPKAADNQTFADKLEHLEGLNLEDGAATATAFVAEAIVKSIHDFIPLTPKKLSFAAAALKIRRFCAFCGNKSKKRRSAQQKIAVLIQWELRRRLLLIWLSDGCSKCRHRFLLPLVRCRKSSAAKFLNRTGKNTINIVFPDTKS